jgi:site-specific recombinase XerD
VALHIYRRHRRDCKAGHPEDSLSSELQERKKGWKRCDCPLTASGTLAGRYRRQSTRQWEWEAAKAVTARWEANRTWGDVTPPQPTQLPQTPPRVTIADATQAFLDKVLSRALAQATNHKYETFVRQFHAFADHKGYIYVDQLTISDMDAFYASWKDGKRARGRKLHKLQSFIQFCLRRKWIADDITEDISPPAGHSIPANKTPFSDEELDRMFAACDKLGPPTQRGRAQRLWGGEDAKDLIYVMLYTGLRIGDVVSFDVSTRLNGNNIFLRMHKTRKEVFSWIPEWLVERIRSREARLGTIIFKVGKTNSLERQTQVWRIRLGKIFALAGPFQTDPVPHQFRHTFVRILLQRGVSPGDVAELIGDTERTLLAHYAKWVSCSALKLTSAFDVCFLKWCTGQVGSVQTFLSSPLSMPSATMASVVYLHIVNSGRFAFSGVSGFSCLISTYLLRGIIFSPSACCLYAVLIWTSSGLAATLAFTCASSFKA